MSYFYICCICLRISHASSFLAFLLDSPSFSSLFHASQPVGREGGAEWEENAKGGYYKRTTELIDG